MTRRFTQRNSGFTLVELLAATAIMTVLILVVVGLTSTILNVWTRSMNRLSINQEGITALRLLNDDFAQSVIDTRRERVWLEVTQNTPAGQPGTASFPTVFLTTYVGSLRPTASADDISSECAVAWTIAFKNPFTGNKDVELPPPPVFGLYRAVVDSTNSFEGPFSLPAYDGSATTLLSGWWNDPASLSLDYSEPPKSLSARTWQTYRDNFISANVVDFKFTVYVKEPAGTVVPVSSLKNVVKIVCAGSKVYVNGSLVDGTFSFAEVYLNVLSEEGMKTYIGQVQSGLTVDWDALVREYGKTYLRRLIVYGQAI